MNTRVIITAMLTAVIIAASITAVAAENATITGDSVMVHGNPSLSPGRIAGDLARGARVEVKSETTFLSTIDGHTAPWYEIVFGGKTGYVFGRYVTIDPGAKVNVDYPDKNADYSNRVARFVRDNLASLGATQSEIVKRLGPPVSTREIVSVDLDRITPDHAITYDGISFEIYGTNGADGSPYRLTCTSGSYSFDGLKVGSSEADVRTFFGGPGRADGDHLIFDAMLSAYLSAVFRIENGKVTWIRLENVPYD